MKIHPITLPAFCLLSNRLKWSLYQMDSLTESKKNWEKYTNPVVPNDKNKSNCMIYFSFHLPSLRFRNRAIVGKRSLNLRGPPPTTPTPLPHSCETLINLVCACTQKIGPNKNTATAIIRDHGFLPCIVKAHICTAALLPPVTQGVEGQDGIHENEV